MAYAFDKIMSMVDPSKANIFGGQDGSQSVGEQPGEPGVQKSSAGSDISSGQTAQQGKSASFAAPLPVSPQAKAPKLTALTDVETKITTNQQRLQDEANQYKKTQLAQQKYDVSQPDIESALSGDQEKSNKIFSTLQQTKPKVEEFKPTQFKRETEQLGSDTGIQSYLRKQATPRYTLGSSAYDLSLLKKDPEFYTNLRKMQGREQDLEGQYRNYLNPDSGLQSEVAKVGVNELEQAKQNIRKYLADQQAMIDNANVEQSQIYNTKLANLAGDTGGALADYIRGTGAGVGDIQPDLKMAIAANPELEKYLTPEIMGTFGIDPAAFGKITGKPTTALDFMSGAEAQRYNNILGLLGKGGAVVAGEEPTAMADIDRQKYIDAVIGAAEGRNKTANEKALADIAAIQGRARGALTQAQQFDTPQARQEMIAADAARARRNLEGVIIPEDIAASVDQSQFYRPGGIPDDWTKFLTEDEASRLNAASEELLDPRRFSRGEFSSGFNAGGLDYGAYQQALRQALAARAGLPLPSDRDAAIFSQPLPIMSI